jgi:hypothetical protein
MKKAKKILIGALALLIIFNLWGCDKYKPYREALIGEWCDEEGLVGFHFIDEKQCEVYFAREYVVDSIACDYTYDDGRARIYHPNDPERYVWFSFSGNGDADDLTEFYFAGMKIYKGEMDMKSRADWAEAHAQTSDGSLNEFVDVYLFTRDANEAIDWIIDQLVAQ